MDFIKVQAKEKSKTRSRYQSDQGLASRVQLNYHGNWLARDLWVWNQIFSLVCRYLIHSMWKSSMTNMVIWDAEWSHSAHLRMQRHLITVSRLWNLVNRSTLKIISMVILALTSMGGMQQSRLGLHLVKLVCFYGNAKAVQGFLLLHEKVECLSCKGNHRV
jgi:hypothetical protein